MEFLRNVNTLLRSHLCKWRGYLTREMSWYEYLWVNLVSDDSLYNGENSVIIHTHKFNLSKNEIRLNFTLWFNSHLLYITLFFQHD